MIKETTFYAFDSNIRSFLEQLLHNPINATLTPFLKERGIDKDKLIKLLIKRGMISRNEKIINRIKSNDGKIKYAVKYTIKNDNFKGKMKDIYTTLFENKMTECDCGATSASSSGAFVGPLGGDVISQSKPSNNGLKKRKVSPSKKGKRKIFITEEQYNIIKEIAIATVGDMSMNIF